MTIELVKLEKLFNAAIRALAAQGLFPKKIDALLDATDDEATPTYVTDGGGEVPHVRREKRPDVRSLRVAGSGGDARRGQGRQLASSNRDRMLVIIGARYAVLRSAEFALLVGVSVRDREALGDTVEAVLRRYGVPVAATNTS